MPNGDELVDAGRRVTGRDIAARDAPRRPGDPPVLVAASERIRGVSYASEISTINKNVLDALLSTLNNDPNSNVRLMTLDALTDCAVRASRLRRALNVHPSTVPFPGRP